MNENIDNESFNLKYIIFKFYCQNQLILVDLLHNIKNNKIQ